MNDEEFLASYLSHAYDPVKAREYYLRTRKLKGRATSLEKAKAKEYENRTTADAQKRLSSDLKTLKVKKNPKRRIGEAEQKLIRAKSLANRVKDPVLKADLLAKLSETEKKLKAVKSRMNPSTKPGSTRPVLKKKPLHTKPDKAGRPPGDPNYGDDPPAKRS